ncbi:MAG TPA: long-chain fatty acid--CoA ligase [Bacteroidia bacterium]|jgi:long-chain acyl-CoA synthetase|nr:long-chain fatty acid--CoA ligase [Bacteroidia bacterium]
MQINRVFDILTKIEADFSYKTDLLCSKEKKGGWRCFTAADFVANTNYVAAALIQKGIKPGDKIALISNNRPEWNFVDYGCQQAGAILVPVYPTISQTDLQFILKHAEIKAVFISTPDLFKKLLVFRNEWSFDFVCSFNETEGAASFSSFTETGKQHYNEHKAEIEKIKRNIKPDDLLSILYTSGTTGTPKGVMISHRNLISNIQAVEDFVPFESSWRNLSFLPLNHIYERMFNTLMLYLGVSIYYAQGLETIPENLKEVKPEMFVTVPRLMERMFDKILSKGHRLKGIKKKIFDWALELSLKYEPDGANGFIYELKRKIADKLVYSKWREALGGNIMYVASGGAALQPRLARSFSCAGILTLQGYGLTETSPVVAVGKEGKGNNKFGYVGAVIEDVTVKIAEDGEILVKGPNVMLGYYKNPEATAEVIDSEGWFHTGDIGVFEGKFLKITDRKKEIFKTSSGKYIAPLVLENKLKECRFVEQCMVIGEGQKFASALIVPSFEYIKEWCGEKGIAFTSNSEIIHNADLKKEINTFIRELNKTLAPYEQLKRAELLSTPWSIDGGEMTPKMSLKRKVISEKNKEAFEKIFSVED